MLCNFTKTSALVMLTLTILLGGCTVKDFNTGRGAWNAPEYVYQPPRVKRKYAAALRLWSPGMMRQLLCSLSSL